jgi:NAD(P)-dependent dehydrogenase (short-subunit alcohol dehydrogenase family)
MLTHGGGHIANVTTSLVDNADSDVSSVLAPLTIGGLQSAHQVPRHRVRQARHPHQRRLPGHHQDHQASRGSHPVLAALQPVGWMGEVSDIVDAVIHLETAPFVTGQILHVDGGVSAGR